MIKKGFFIIFLLSFLLPRPAWAQMSMFGRLLREGFGQETILSRFGRLLDFLNGQERDEKESPVLTAEVLGVTVPIPELTVAVLGDSMVDVLRQSLPQLRTALENHFPKTKLNLYNFGVGATDMEYALFRLTNGYRYMSGSYSSVLSVNPDVLVLESFAYNNFGDSQEGLDKQWLLIAGIIDQVKKVSSKTEIVLASTIAPNSSVYGDGIDGIGWPPDQKRARAETVKKYLQNMVNFAASEGYPLADAYHSSMDENGQGKLEYISTADHLHLSGPGGVLFCQKVADTIRGLW
ncbi:MAG: SGNH/GDSL hydrolase family protein [Patescibacteria group bacterium]